ncbi:MAG TPA: M28 family metallopeptidase, partial [Vicinamibacterales bacterium]
MIAAAICVGAAASQPADRIRADITFLASDLLEGREAGTRGFDIAAEYVAAQFRQIGLVPAGDEGTYFQRVPLIATRLTDQGSFILKSTSGQTMPLAFAEEYVPSRSSVAGTRHVAGPLVFAGFGIVAPERGIDDYRGLDVAGKIVVLLAGAPADLQTEERAYYASARTKRTEASRHGAIGFLTLNTPAEEKRRRFSDISRTFDSWGMTWRRSDGTPFDVVSGAPPLGTFSVAAGRKLFVGAPATYEDVVAHAESNAREMPRFALSWALDATSSTETKNLESRNVVGLLPGSDKTLNDDVIVLSAHLDHLGITRPVNGDAINNGALDNAAGVATTLEVARMFAASDRRPRRSILFLADTAEEKGLVGSEYFAKNPTVPLAHIVAAVDLDMPVLQYGFTDVVAFGAERSTIGDAVRQAASRLRVALSPDPLPEEGIFTRSDHYRFVEAGVPAVMLMTGFANGGEKKFRDFLAACYHRPCDDVSHPIDYEAGAKFARVNYEIASELADAPDP